MYATVQHEAWRQRSLEIRQQLAAIRLERTMRVHGVKTPGLLRDLGWELARAAGLLGKRLRQAPGNATRGRTAHSREERTMNDTQTSTRLATPLREGRTRRTRPARSGNEAEGGHRVKA